MHRQVFPNPAENSRNTYKLKDEAKNVKYPSEYCGKFFRQLAVLEMRRWLPLSFRVCERFYGGGAQWVMKKYFMGSCVQENLGNAALDLEVKVNFALEQATKAQRGNRRIALLFLQPRR